MSVCLSWAKMRRRNDVAQMRAYSKSVLGGFDSTLGTALAWTKKKHSLRNEKLKANRLSETEEQEKERLRIRRENMKTENHKKQLLATLKRLKCGDDNELERNMRLEKVVASKQPGWPW